MKTIILICLASLFFVLSAHSQISKGTVLLGGNLGFSKGDVSTSTDNYKDHSFYISPSLGFVVKENRVIGLSLQYGHGIYNNGTQNSQNDQYGGGIFYRRYLPLSKGFYMYGQGVVGTTYIKREEVNSNLHTHIQTSTYISVFPGVAYAVSKRFHLELALNNMLNLNYSTTKNEFTNVGTSGPSESKSSQFAFNVNANPTSDLVFGFRVLLGNK